MDVSAADFKFDWLEYSVVAFMLLLSNLIGVYYAFFSKQSSFSDYMLGGKAMGIFPVSMSLVASFISGVNLLGIPSEIYLYGTQYTAINIANVTIMVLTGVFYLPVYFKLQLNSIFEYLELRFNRYVRIIGTTLYSLSLVTFLPSVIFVPALAFNQVSDVPVHILTPIISSSCLFYTAFGGLKAVLWTDALQNTFTLLAVVFVVVLGTVRLGGVSEIWRINEEGHRLEFFNLNPDPFTRNTFWNVSIGCIFMFLTNIAVNPGSMQRFLAVPSLRHARVVLFCSSVGFYIIGNLCNYLGLVIFARYHGCDPISTKQIKNPGQLVPLYLMEVSRDYPGLAGLFMSGVLSAALSTMSAWLNTVGGTLYKDIMEVFFPNTQHSERKQSNIIKAIVLTMGVICTILVFVIEKLGTLVQMQVSLLGMVYGSFLSLFSLGIFFPQVNVKGAVTGTLSSLLLSGWIIINAQYKIIEGNLKFPGKITRIDKCPASIFEHVKPDTSWLFNYTGVGSPVVADSSVPLIYKLSFNYYIPLGTLTGLIVGLVVSYLTEAPDPKKLNPDLFTPYVHRFLPSKVKQKPDRNDYILTLQKDLRK